MNKHAIGKNMKKHLDRKGWTMTRLSQEINVTPTAVQNWAHGKRTPSAYALYRMSKALGTTMEELVEGIDGEKN